MSYPVHLTVGQDEGQNRLWGIPFLGIIARWFLLIPHFFILFFLAIAIYVYALVSWIPVLINGRQADAGYALADAYFTVAARVAMYMTLITGKYPPFGWTGDHPVNVTFERGESQNRLWGVPFLGVLVRWILLIPHAIAIWILSIVLALLFLVSWIPVLLNGRQASAIVDFTSGFYRWSTRVVAYGLLLTGSYPPFSLSD
ncbi:MAG TPA: DUF4389 domain-containing protein [Candidatus Limnocylindrales bacterium]